MSFGRWLLVHSFSIALLIIFLLGYVYRSELQLQKAYHQLINSEPESMIQKVDAGHSKEVKDMGASGLAEPAVQNTATLKKSVESQKNNTLPSNIKPGSLSTVPTIPEINGNLHDKVNTDEQLYLARQAYRDKNYKQAIYLYRQLIQKDRFNPDYMGELGNIYYSLNDYDNASMLYYQAALQLIELKEFDLASSLVAPVLAMNRELGEKLKLKLQ